MITLVAVTFFLNVEQQGRHYTFVSVAALYSIFEIGLASAVLQVAAHVFTQISWGGNGEVVVEDQSEFNALVSKSFRIYLKLAILFTLLVLPIGLFIFNARDGGLEIGSKDESLQAQRNSLTAPYLWILCLLAVIPAHYFGNIICY